MENNKGSGVNPDGETEYTKLIKENRMLRRAMREISQGVGKYSDDPLEYSQNTIKSMKEIAMLVLEDI